MAFARSLKCLTFDVTGTLVSFKGRLGTHYLDCAKRCGLRFKNGNTEQLESGFDKAYDETHQEYPCVGAVHNVSAKDWWRRCIIRSFEIAREDAGADPDVPALDANQQERVFQRIYALFGSHATYGVFADVIPFLTWARRRKIVTGIISNADERYGDAILPMLDLSDHLDFTVFARDVSDETQPQDLRRDPGEGERGKRGPLRRGHGAHRLQRRAPRGQLVVEGLCGSAGRGHAGRAARPLRPRRAP